MCVMILPHRIQLRTQLPQLTSILEQVHGDGAECVRNCVRPSLLNQLSKASESPVSQFPLDDWTVELTNKSW